MSRAERLLCLLDVLRRHRRPVAAHRLADELGVSIRTVYRDLQSLIGQGADIDGEAGIGFVLRPGYLLPPLMFRPEELEALALGLQWVRVRGDPAMARAAADALGRISSVLPDGHREALHDNGLLTGPAPSGTDPVIDMAVLRAALRTHTKLTIAYRDAGGTSTDRTVWPVGLAFFEQVRILIAWCELRRDFRHFRVDRIDALSDTAVPYRPGRRALLKQWRAQEGIAEP